MKKQEGQGKVQTILQQQHARHRAFNDRIEALASQREKMRPLPAVVQSPPVQPSPPPVSIPKFNPVLLRVSTAAYESAWHNEICGTDFAEIVVTDRIKIRAIKREVCELFCLREEAFLSKRRQRDLVVARQIAMWLAKIHTDLSLPQIGRTLGDRDHTTILHGINRIDGLLSKDEHLRGQIAMLEIRLGFVRAGG